MGGRRKKNACDEGVVFYETRREENGKEKEIEEGISFFNMNCICFGFMVDSIQNRLMQIIC